MMPRIDRILEGSPERIIVFRALVIGDMLCAVPAVRALRGAYPRAQITLVGLPWAREFAARFSKYVDAFIEFPGFPGLPERVFDAQSFPRFLDEVLRRRADLVLQMHGSGSFVNPLCELMGATITAGYFVPGEYCPSPNTYLAYPNDVSEVHRHLQLMQFLGIPSCGDHLELPLLQQDQVELASLPEYSELQDGPYVCIHPGARYSSRRWHPDRYAEVGDILASNGLRIVITGTTAEAELAAKVAHLMKAPAINLASRTSLGALGALLKGARLLISNDTGVSHVAAALQVPSVVVVTGSDPHRWAPLDQKRHQTVMGPVECRPCEHVVCPIGFMCADAVTVDDVARRALLMLDQVGEPVTAG